MSNVDLTKQTGEQTDRKSCKGCICDACAKQGIAELCTYCRKERCGAIGSIDACSAFVSIRQKQY